MDLPGTRCDCGETLSKVGELLTTGKSMPLYGCLKCDDVEGISMTKAVGDGVARTMKAKEPTKVLGLIWMGQAFKLTISREGSELRGGLEPVAHPDDVWG